MIFETKSLLFSGHQAYTPPFGFPRRAEGILEEWGSYPHVMGFISMFAALVIWRRTAAEIDAGEREAANSLHGAYGPGSRCSFWCGLPIPEVFGLPTNKLPPYILPQANDV